LFVRLGGGHDPEKGKKKKEKGEQPATFFSFFSSTLSGGEGRKRKEGKKKGEGKKARRAVLYSLLLWEPLPLKSPVKEEKKGKKRSGVRTKMVPSLFNAMRAE